jgi:RecA-family ATPase
MANDDGAEAKPYVVERRWNPPLDADGLPLIEEEDEYDRNTAPPDLALPVVSASSLADAPIPTRKSIVTGWIPDNNVTLLSGDGGVGKSLLNLQLGVAVAAGRQWLGMPTEQGPVIVLSAEDDLDELHIRLAAIAESYGITLADLTDLHLIPLAGRDAVLAAPKTKMGIVESTALWGRLVAQVEKIKPRLVIIDTLADVFAGNENVRTEASPVHWLTAQPGDGP